MYLYDADGIRTQKTVDGVTTQYFVSGSTILAEKTGNDVLWYMYDSDGEILGFIYNLTPYYYVKNAQGDVYKVVNESGTVVASYTYDPWGKVLTATGSMAEINPIRYRGYYYDEETGFYYVSSRYYDPEIGRWLNADSVIAGVGCSVQGYNMFSYCFNNPVNMTDNSGTWPIWDNIKAGFKNVADWVDNNIIQPVVGFVEDIAKDINNFDLNNESEEKVLKSNYFSSYKGLPVIRTNLERSGSYGVLFISRKASERSAPEDEVRHEYGHTKQLDQLGLVKYTMCIGVPSMFEWGSDPVYYRRPWEITADIYGGVQSRSYPEYEAAGFEYLENSKRWGPLVWLTID